MLFSGQPFCALWLQCFENYFVYIAVSCTMFPGQLYWHVEQVHVRVSCVVFEFAGVCSLDVDFFTGSNFHSIWYYLVGGWWGWNQCHFADMVSR